MISPELLRRYSFFSFLDDSQLIALALVAEEFTFERDEKIFDKGDRADALYFLINGSVGLYYPGGGKRADNSHSRYPGRRDQSGRTVQHICVDRTPYSHFKRMVIHPKPHAAL